MTFLLVVALVACSQTVSDTGLVDSPSESRDSGSEEFPICTTDEFCGELLDCFGFMSVDRCEDYFLDGMGVCADASEDELAEYHACMCSCWPIGDEGSCISKGMCSDMCSTTHCTIL